MADTYGGLELPMPQGELGARAPDKALDAIGSYIKAVGEYLLGAAWSAVAPGEALIKNVFTVRPDDALINPNANLPGLFLWRGPSQQSREGDDYLINRTQVGCTWLIWWDQPLKREILLPFQGAFTNAVHSALGRGRHPAWVVPGDATAGAATRGSVLMQQAGLFEPLDRITSNEIEVSLDPERTGNVVRYKALSLTIPIAERAFRDPALFCVPTISTVDPDNASPPGNPEPAALDLTVSQADNTIDQLKP